MSRRRFNFLTPAAVAGVALSVSVAAIDAAGGLARLERYLYDERVRHCQAFMPRPTDRLVHLDIDDTALEDVQRWPWDRALFADVLDELALACPKAVALDLLLTEPQDDKWVRGADGTFRLVPQDAALADALGRFGTTLVPASFRLNENAANPLFVAVCNVLVGDVELEESAVAAKLAGHGGAAASSPADIDRVFLAAQREAMFQRIKAELERRPGDEADLRRRVLPRTPVGVKDPRTRLFTTQFRRAAAAIALQRHARPLVPGRTPPLPEEGLSLLPIAPLVRRATTTGFVDYPRSRDERVRSVPLFIREGNFLYPQFGLSLACAMLGVPLEQVELAEKSVTIPLPGRAPLVIPTHTLAAKKNQNTDRPIPLAIDLPWFGPEDWTAMYAGPGRPRGAQHVPIVTVYDACATRNRILSSNLEIDEALKAVYELGDPDKLAGLLARPLPPADWNGRVALVRIAVADTKEFVGQFAETLRDTPAAAQSEKDKAQLEKARRAIASYGALQQYERQVTELAAQLDRQRRYLWEAFHDKAVIVGWTASSSIADFVATPLHDRCPGPVVHGVVFNAILTGEFWRAAPSWSAVAVTLLAGFVATLVVARFSPPVGLLLSLLILAAYTAINGVLLFDYGNLIVDLAGPLTAVAVVWAGGTLTQLVSEQHYRAMIRRRFRTYVDPKLVDYVERNPKQAGFTGERREMTVVFTDLVGFTRLTEVMGEKTVTLLNELWGRVVPVVRQSGYLNKFLGDGLMFFYGAPMPNAHHARDTVRTVLELETVMARFRDEVTDPRGLPPLAMRIGVSTGDMIVGDAGAGEAGSDYTVLGDVVNLGARLEGANKAFDTRNLMTARTAELAGDEFLFRPIASLYVVGKEHAVDTVEAVCRRDQATEIEVELVRLTECLVTAYRRRRLQDCLAAADALDRQTGPSKLATLYRELATRQLRVPADQPFDPAISLTSK